MQLKNLIASLVIGVVVFVVVTVGVTELLNPIIWLAIVFGAAAGAFAAVGATGLSYAGLAVITERRRIGTVSVSTRRRSMTLAGSVCVGGVAALLVVAGMLLQATGVVFAMMVGGVVGVAAGGVGAVAIWLRLGQHEVESTTPT